MTQIVYTDQETFEEPVIEVDSSLDESQITATIGHDDWEYVIDDAPVAQAMKPQKGMVVAVAIALLPLLILPASAKWQSQWPTAWAEVNNTRYLIPYFPGKRLIGNACYFLGSDGSLRRDGPSNQAGECSEG